VSSLDSIGDAQRKTAQRERGILYPPLENTELLATNSLETS
jgi:hypothetical protein